MREKELHLYRTQICDLSNLIKIFGAVLPDENFHQNCCLLTTTFVKIFPEFFFSRWIWSEFLNPLKNLMAFLSARLTILMIILEFSNKFYEIYPIYQNCSVNFSVCKVQTQSSD